MGVVSCAFNPACTELCRSVTLEIAVETGSFLAFDVAVFIDGECLLSGIVLDLEVVSLCLDTSILNVNACFLYFAIYGIDGIILSSGAGDQSVTLLPSSSWNRPNLIVPVCGVEVQKYHPTV